MEIIQAFLDSSLVQFLFWVAVIIIVLVALIKLLAFFAMRKIKNVLEAKGGEMFGNFEDFIKKQNQSDDGTKVRIKTLPGDDEIIDITDTSTDKK